MKLALATLMKNRTSLIIVACYDFSVRKYYSIFSLRCELKQISDLEISVQSITQKSWVSSRDFQEIVVT